MKLSILTPRSMSALAARAAVPRLDLTTAAWQELVHQVTISAHRQRYTGGALRSAVFAVVREMRSHLIPWESVYNALSAVAGAPSLELVYALDCHSYTSRQASLVAHMHAWADCERLEEIERSEADGSAA